MTPKRIDPEAMWCDGALWEFRTARYRIVLWGEPEDMAPEDSFCDERDIAFAREDEPAHWFCAIVSVYSDAHDGKEIGRDVLGGCSYRSFREFYTSHRRYKSRDYFGDMVRAAINDARRTLAQHRDGMATAA